MDSKIEENDNLLNPSKQSVLTSNPIIIKSYCRYVVIFTLVSLILLLVFQRQTGRLKDVTVHGNGDHNDTEEETSSIWVKEEEEKQTKKKNKSLDKEDINILYDDEDEDEAKESDGENEAEFDEENENDFFSLRIENKQNIEEDEEQDSSENISHASKTKNKKNVPEVLGWIQTSKGVRNRAYDCEKRLQITYTTKEENDLVQADCGHGYDYLHSQGRRLPWKVVFFGRWRHDIAYYSGCPNRCPLSPKCEIVWSELKENLTDANVIVMSSPEWRRDLTLLRNDTNELFHQNVYHVLYWREAFWNGPSESTQKRDFDILMGVHQFSGLINPSFLLRPSDLLQGIYLNEGQTQVNFAASVFSDCKTRSYRQSYLIHLINFLGPDRVHQYGECGNRKLPPKPIINAMKVLSTYKLYEILSSFFLCSPLTPFHSFLAFENTIQMGYVTEKLFSSLLLPSIPVYYGALDAPNITKTASYIRVSDFQNPKALATYLMYLDENPSEYQKYSNWRKEKNPFTDEYLDMLKNRAPGPQEILYHENSLPKQDWWLKARAAQCCRLCDENYVKYAADFLKSTRIRKIMPKEEIQRVFYAGAKFKGH